MILRDDERRQEENVTANEFLQQAWEIDKRYLGDGKTVETTFADGDSE